MLAVIVPMKSLRLAKQRLRPAVADGERLYLARTMLAHVLTAVNASGVADLPLVVSPDPEVLALARVQGFGVLCERQPGYNEAVTQAAIWAQERGAASVLVLPADLPRLEPGDVRAMVVLAGEGSRAVVIAPDSGETGTNALLLRPPFLLPFSFGPASFARHCALARAAGVEPAVYRSPSLAHDIDLPEDLRHLGQAFAIDTQSYFSRQPGSL
jgi:2-phospho-L-lactate guanylyltransferase